mmetsp:Transcript_36281/g.95641  ORF Transcript_36281/g.95641 Transcript_36281/m.95641 type:complete len:249 (-) Transcript_36281:140-886(-)
MASLARMVCPLVDRTVLPTLALHFERDLEDLTVRDLFIARYDSREVGTGAQMPQRSLPMHRDGNLLSFSVLLSRPGLDFGGGGLRFASVGPIASNSGRRLPLPCVGCGDLTVHCGKLLHEVSPLVFGRRYVLVGFVHVASPLTPLDEYVAAAKFTVWQGLDRPACAPMSPPADVDVLSECAASSLMIEDSRTGVRYTTVEAAPLLVTMSFGGSGSQACRLGVGRSTAAVCLQRHVRGSIARQWMPALI